MDIRDQLDGPQRLEVVVACDEARINLKRRKQKLVHDTNRR